jgi:hypothetical protein
MISTPKVTPKASVNVDVTWSWYDLSQGIVKWTFRNNVPKPVPVILLRGAEYILGTYRQVLIDYYFGNAYFPIYVANPQFNVKWQIDNEVLKDNGVENNSPPLGVIKFGDKYLVAFVFVLPPAHTPAVNSVFPPSEWSMLEGGFGYYNGGILQPYNPQVFELEYAGDYDFCIGYDVQQVQDWDAQTGTTMQGYQPNPSTFKVSLYIAPQNAPYIELFNNSIAEGTCSENACQRLLNKLKNSINDAIRDKLLSIDYADIVQRVIKSDE